MPSHEGFFLVCFFLVFFRKAKIISPAVTGAMQSGADIEDTAGSASLQAANDENGIFFAPLPEKTAQD